MGLGCNWTADSIEYVIALKQGTITGADYEIDLPDKWTEVRGRTKQLGEIYGRIYEDGPLLYEIEELTRKETAGSDIADRKGEHYEKNIDRCRYAK